MLPFVAAVLETPYRPRLGEALSGIFGSVSLTAWICLLLPQLITNYKSKSADALSMKFLLIWLLGDICNLSGALFTSLAPSTIALASYFCVADLILISQCTYYNTINARRRAAAAARREAPHHHHHHRHHRHQGPLTGDNLDANASSAIADHHSAPPPTESDPLLPSSTRPLKADVLMSAPHHRRESCLRRDSMGSATGPLQADPLARIITGEDNGAADSSPWLYNTVSLVAVWVVGAAGWYFSYKMGAWGVGKGDGDGDGAAPVPGDGDEVMEKPVAVIGMVLGYASALCYLCARIPQIIKNYREKSCEGLALLFFLLSLTGNFTYGASVMSYSQEWDYFVRALPWLLGSLGTMVEDCIIFVQFRIYSPKRQLKGAGTA
ncbi:PQ loop repeat-domain-containing protein [Corynascus novoguineensis]|uniref:PQ loop repeat-domain-containing protein n=1 Tax=Corynascus novoguineensis TaxID=1126955 RepID=A0AAN7CZY7_9PEZI|nr:PQ loop repeat-domain-containing protein [Corynascus novoguineensis]